MLVARAARRELAKRSFTYFARHTWDTIPMTRPLVPSVAFDAVCAALQAVADGRIKLLLVNQPPGTAKSVIGAVSFPAYLFHRSDGRERVMVGSYSHKFALRDATRCRDLMTSDVYRALTDDRWRIRRYPDRMDDFWLTGGGRRIVVSPNSATGERCTVQIIDDPLDASKIYSRTMKDEAVRWIATTLTPRLEGSPQRPEPARVMFMQRLINDDPSRWAIEQGWKVLDLPAVLGRDANLSPIESAACELFDDAGELVWRDERAPGQTLSQLQPLEMLHGIRKTMPAASFAAQYLQRPQDESAAIFRRSYFRRFYESEPEVERTAIALDASFIDADSSDFAVIQAWGAAGSDRFLLEQWRKRAGFVETLGALRGFCDRYPAARILVEAAANGHAIISQLGHELGEGVVEAVPTAGGKRPRWQSIAPIAERGEIVLPHLNIAPWVGEFVTEVCAAPNGDHDDQIDAMAHALMALDDRASQWPDYQALNRRG